MTLLMGRYEILERRPGRATARDVELGADVTIKELVLGRVANWKEVDLFEREARTLQNLDHPRIPKVIDSFRGRGDSPTCFVVFEQTEGVPLSDCIETGDQAMLSRIARDVLDVLVYLQGYSPPVLHRNITTESIIVDAGGRGRLVDFGSVQVELHGTVGGSTIVGTAGYLAPEQLLGRAVPASDVYALGVALVHAITGIDPSDLPVDRMRLQWRDQARFGSERFHAWVDRMIEPSLEGRFANAEDALRGISADSSVASTRAGLLAVRPGRTRVELKRTSRRLVAGFPARRLRVGDFLGFAVAAAMVLLIPFLKYAGAILFAVAVALRAVVYSLQLLGRSVRSRRGAELSLDVERGFRLTTHGKVVSGRLEDVRGVTTGYRGRSDAVWLATAEGMLMAGAGLNPEEVDWLQAELRDFLKL